MDPGRWPNRITVFQKYSFRQAVHRGCCPTYPLVENLLTRFDGDAYRSVRAQNRKVNPTKNYMSYFPNIREDLYICAPKFVELIIGEVGNLTLINVICQYVFVFNDTEKKVSPSIG